MTNPPSSTMLARRSAIKQEIRNKKLNGFKSTLILIGYAITFMTITIVSGYCNN